MPVKFGVLLPLEGAVSGGVPSAERVYRMAEMAEGLGYDSLWVGDRLLLTPRLEPLTTLGAIAARTSKVELGTAVLVVPLRNPVLLAHAIASLDLASKGRLILGVGIGAERIRPEYEAVNVPFGERASRMEESMKIIKLLWRGEEVTRKGKHFNLQKVRLTLRPHQREGPRIWFGECAERSLRRVSTYADGWLPICAPYCLSTPHEFEAGYKQIQSRVSQAGKKIERALYVSVNISRDAKKAQAEAHKFLNAYHDMTFESIEAFGAFGTAEECVRYLASFKDVGVEHFLVRFSSFEPEPQLELFRDEVMHHIRT